MDWVDLDLDLTLLLCSLLLLKYWKFLEQIPQVPAQNRNNAKKISQIPPEKNPDLKVEKNQNIAKNNQ